jgi:hypothetical protein
MAEELTIAHRFRGPPASGNGGYTCGLFALACGTEDVAVSLRVPPPLERALAVERRNGGFAALDGDTVVALAEPATVAVAPPPMPEPAPAGPDDPVYGELDRHPFPGCFTCGPAREPGDGLRIFATRVPAAEGVVASTWTPDASLARYGEVAPEFVWAALDCPTGHACAIDRPAVLARLAVRRIAPVRPGEPHVVAAWRTGRDGRKHHAAGCLYAADGTPVAVSEALWIELRDPAALGAEGG